MPAVDVIVPTLNEAAHLPHLLADLRHLRVPASITVVDGGSHDDTVALGRAAGARVISAPRGRARQMNAGAATGGAAWLCFLHADVRLPADARRDLERVTLEGEADAAVWRLRIDADGWWFRVVEGGAALRDRWGGLPYGDQGLVVRRALFDLVGGFPNHPVMEDVALLRALRRRGPLLRFPSSVVVSARRWRKEGAVRTWLRNTTLLAAYILGVSPVRLTRWYRPHRG